MLDPRAAFALLAAVAVAWLMFEGRHITFQNDEWDWLLHRRGHSPAVFLRPHNEHLSVLPILAYKAFFQIFGASSTFPFRLLDAVLVAIAAGLLFVLVARRLGSWVAFAAAAVLLFFGPGWNDLLWGFQIGYGGSVAAGLGAFLALERRDRLGDALACGLLVVALACSSVGLTVLVGAVVEVAIDARRANWRRLWVVAVPIVLYGLWYAGYGVSTVKLSRAHTLPLYVFQGLSAVAGSITGLTEPSASNPYEVSLDPGTTIAVLFLVGLVLRFIRGRPLSTRFWAAAATALAFWVAAGLSYAPGREANSGHYAYPVAPFLILAIVECCAGWRTNRRSLLVLGAASLAAVASNLGFLHEGAKLFDLTSQYAKAELGAMELAGDAVLPSFRPEDASIAAVIGIHNMVPIDAGSYFAATDAFGSAADSVSVILHQPEAVREASDLVLAKAERLGPKPGHLPGRGCAARMPAGGGIELTSGAGTIVLESGRSGVVNVALRRFADAYNYVALGPVTPGSVTSVTLPRDRSSLPWHIRLFTAAPVTVCPVA